MNKLIKLCALYETPTCTTLYIHTVHLIRNTCAFIQSDKSSDFSCQQEGSTSRMVTSRTQHKKQPKLSSKVSGKAPGKQRILAIIGGWVGDNLKSCS